VVDGTRWAIAQGIADPQRFRGASGGNKSHFTIAETDATPEGHAVDYDETGAVIGMTLVNVQLPLDRDGMLTLSLPPVHIAAEALAPALVAG